MVKRGSGAVFLVLGFSAIPCLADQGPMKIYPTVNCFYSMFCKSGSSQITLDRSYNRQADRQDWQIDFVVYSKFVLQELRSGKHLQDPSVSKFVRYISLAYRAAFGSKLKGLDSASTDQELILVLESALVKHAANDIVPKGSVIDSSDYAKNPQFYSLRLVALDKHLSDYWSNFYRYCCFHILEQLENGKTLDDPELASSIRSCEIAYRKANPGHSLPGFVMSDVNAIRAALLSTEEGQTYSAYPKLAATEDGKYLLKYFVRNAKGGRLAEKVISSTDESFGYYDRIAQHEKMKPGKVVVLLSTGLIPRD